MLLTKRQNVKSRRTFTWMKYPPLFLKHVPHSRQRLYPIKTVHSMRSSRKKERLTNHARIITRQQCTSHCDNAKYYWKQIRCKEKWYTLIVMTRFAVSNGHLLADAWHPMLLTCRQSINLMPEIKFDESKVITTIQECLFIYNPKCANRSSVVTVGMLLMLKSFKQFQKSAQLEINRFNIKSILLLTHVIYLHRKSVKKYCVLILSLEFISITKSFWSKRFKRENHWAPLYT